MRLEISGEYDERWAEIARETKAAAGWRCVRCGHSFHSQNGRAFLDCNAGCDRRRCRAGSIRERGGSHVLTVHHFDGDKANNAWWNRLALCNSCHLYVQASVIPERAFMFHHSDWLVPFVCGFYAHQKGLEITREQAEADPDRWLAMGQPWLYADARRDDAEILTPVGGVAAV